MSRSWRDIAAPVIAKVLSEHADDPALQAKALREAYPFGERRYHPYKVWLDEIKRQTGKKKPPNHSTRFTKASADPNQQSMW